MGFEIENNILRKYINDDNASDIEIPYGIAEIGRFCFSYAENVKSIKISDTVRKIGKLSIERCKNLQSINIPDSVVIIDDYAFSGCESLAYVYIPETVKFIGNNIFSGCKSLAEADISENNPNYLIKDGVLFSRGFTNLLSYNITKPDKYYIVPDTVTRIGSEAFSDCHLIGVELPDSLRIIEHLAFSGCKELTEIKIPEKVIGLSSMTFLCCKNLKSVDIPLSVKEISSYCFDGCESLENLKMPFSVSIGENAFLHCTSIKYLTLFNNKIRFSIHVSNHLRYSDIKKIKDFFCNNFSEEIFSEIRRSDCKIPLALFMLKNFESDFFTSYIKKNIRKALKYIVDEDDCDTLEKLLSSVPVKSKNIDEIFEYALSSQKDNIQLLLENYKNQNKL